MAEAAKSSSSSRVHLAVMRSQLGRARGLGSAKSGSAHWWAERVTSVALVPLTLWFIWSVLHLVGASQETVQDWLAGPISLVLMLCLIWATFYHMQLGLTVVVEDYVHHEGARFGAVLLVKAICIVLGLASVISVLKLGL